VDFWKEGVSEKEADTFILDQMKPFKSKIKKIKSKDWLRLNSNR
jgi:hypothetical protein